MFAIVREHVFGAVSRRKAPKDFHGFLDASPHVVELVDVSFARRLPTPRRRLRFRCNIRLWPRLSPWVGRTVPSPGGGLLVLPLSALQLVFPACSRRLLLQARVAEGVLGDMSLRCILEGGGHGKMLPWRIPEGLLMAILRRDASLRG